MRKKQKQNQNLLDRFKNLVDSSFIASGFSLLEEVSLIEERELLAPVSQNRVCLIESLSRYSREGSFLFYQTFGNSLCVLEFCAQSLGKHKICFDVFVRFSHLPTLMLLCQFQGIMFNPIAHFLWMGCRLSFFFPDSYSVSSSQPIKICTSHARAYELSFADDSVEIISELSRKVKKYLVPWLESARSPEAMLFLCTDSYADNDLVKPITPDHIRQQLERNFFQNNNLVPTKTQIVLCLTAGFLDEAEIKLRQLLDAYQLFKEEKRKYLNSVGAGQITSGFSVNEFVETTWDHLYASQSFVDHVHLYTKNMRSQSL